MPKSNVNPDHYKTAGRERQGENLVPEIDRKALSEARARYERQRARRPTNPRSRIPNPERKD